MTLTVKGSHLNPNTVFKQRKISSVFAGLTQRGTSFGYCTRITAKNYYACKMEEHCLQQLYISSQDNGFYSIYSSSSIPCDVKPLLKHKKH